MFSYDLKVGYSCNNKCKHCVIDDSKDRLVERKKSIDLSTEECFSLINQAIRNKIYWLNRRRGFDQKRFSGFVKKMCRREAKYNSSIKWTIIRKK